MTEHSATLYELLNEKTSSAMRRADSLVRARYNTDAGFDVVRAVEVEQALDDADRYARLQDRLGTLEQRAGSGPYAPGGASLVRDLVHQSTDPAARERLAHLKRDSERAGLTERAAGSSSMVGFVPPTYLTDQVAVQVGAGRPLADLIGSRPIPPKGMTLETGRVTTASSAAQQSTENAATSTNDIELAGISIPVRTIATTATISRQMFERAGVGWNDGLLGDMLEAHAVTVDSILVSALLAQASTQTLAYDDATPTGAEFVQKLAAVSSTASTARKRPVTAYVMHSRRWFWLASRVEAGLTQIGNDSIMGIARTIDDNIPTNLGAGTNEDRVLAIRPDDHRLFESSPYVLVAPQAAGAPGNARVVITIYSYLAFTAARYPTGIGILTGTGLAAVAS
jgi:HK97 family phage major capsid protein